MPLAELAEDIAEEGIFATGVQASVLGPSGHVDVAVGELAPGVPVHSSTLFNGHCASKPLTALALGLLVDNGSVDPDAPVGQIVKAGSPFATLKADTWSVLTHSAGLGAPLLAEIYLSPVAERADLVRTGVEQAEGGYSEYASQALIVEMIESVTGERAEEFIRGELLGPLGLAGQMVFGFSSAELKARQDSVGFYTVGLPTHPRRLLHDRSPHVACGERVALGAYLTAQGLATFYASAGRVLGGERVDGLPSTAVLQEFLAHRRQKCTEPLLRRSCAFAAGFMVDLVDHGYGDALGPDAFGHSGWLGASFGFFDPTTGVAGAVVSNGLSRHQEDFDFARARFVRAMIAAGFGR